ncbi:MAG: HAD-IC family P-type ATPase [bacterium]|nr:HAD-IC family P-type ATPase [bacterium]
MARPWYSFTLEKIFEKIESSDLGLSLEAADERLKQYGGNSLPEEKPRSKPRLFLSQFQSPLIYILLAASAVVFVMGETMDGLIILTVLLFNAIIGVIQEGKAQNTLLALKKFVATSATVLRDGKEFIIPDIEVVPGDVLILQEGERISADARVIFSQSLKIDEASLTGESEPIHKNTNVLEKDNLPTAEQKNMVWKGTHVVSGNGRAIVVATGLGTVIGSIAKQISAIDTETPLKANIRHLSRAIIVAVVIIGTVLFTAGMLFGHSAKEMFTTVVSLSVSIIPEGLPIVMTLVLATGVWRMSKRNALVKRLQAVEALGQARVIAVDKTGTITKNELVIRKAWAGGKLFEVGGIGYEPKGEIKFDKNLVSVAKHDELLYLGKTTSLVASARLFYVEEAKEWRIAGDPTEAAMLVFAEKAGFRKEDLLRESPLISEIPFDYKMKYRATLHQTKKGHLLIVTGAPEKILSLCVDIRRGGKNHPLETDEKEELEKIFAGMSEEGLRVIAVAACDEASKQLKNESIHSLSFVGFFGMQDTLRPEVKGAMQRAKEAGIRVVMITGDHKITARAIAKEAGIYQEGDTVLTGDEIEKMYDAELADKLANTTVFARVTPEHKMQIINAYKKRGEIIAMTGDGVNDAPSLVAADLGVSMGKIGTEVAKESSDIVLLDDNFGSIISAIEEGRSIYKTIKKVILYLFSTSAGEVLVISVALFLGYPLPIIAAQIIWLNFVTDGFLVVALAMEPKEEGLLSGKFEHPKKYIIDSLMIQRMIIMALPMMIGTLFLFSRYFEADIAKAWTISLTTLAIFQWFNVWNCRSENKSIFKMDWFSNKYLVGATFAVIILQVIAIYMPVMQKILRTVPLEFSEWLLIIPVAASIIVAEESSKLFYRRRKKYRSFN